MSSNISKIGYVVKRYPRYSETFIVNEILAHEKTGIEIEIFSLRPPEDTHFQNIISEIKAPVTYLPNRVQKSNDFWMLVSEAAKSAPDIWDFLNEAKNTDAREVTYAVTLAKHIRERGINHLHAHFATSSATVARLAAMFTGITYSFTAHAKDIYHESINADDLIRKIHDAASVITVSDYNKCYLSKTFLIKPEKITRVYNGLDLNRYLYKSPTIRKPKIIGVGRLVEKKGYNDLIAACRHLKDDNIEFSCVIIGEGPEHDNLTQQIKEQELGNYVSLSGPQPQNQVIRAIQDAAVFVAPCIIGQDGNRDGLPTVLLESMALGTPCISTNVTGIPEIIQNGITGILVKQHDPKSISIAIKKLLHDPLARKSLATNARQLIENKFDIIINTQQIRKIAFPYGSKIIDFNLEKVI